jgi:hypothetical protein
VHASRRGDRGASSTEAALLLGAIFVIALPVIVILGRTVGDSFDSACDNLAQGKDEACVSTQSGGPPAIRPASRNVAVAPAADWVTRTYPDTVASEIECDAVPDPPPAGTSSNCVITLSDGSTVDVVVTWGDGEPTVRPA